MCMGLQVTLLLLLLLPGVCSGADTLTEGGTLPERERRFLGCIRLSLAALYQAEVVDGTFKVNGTRSWRHLSPTCSL